MGTMKVIQVAHTRVSSSNEQDGQNRSGCLFAPFGVFLVEDEAAKPRWKDGGSAAFTPKVYVGCKAKKSDTATCKPLTAKAETPTMEGNGKFG